MPATVKKFEKDGKSFPTLELKGENAKPDSYGFVFGLSKARLILSHLDAIKKFVADNTVPSEGE